MAFGPCHARDRKWIGTGSKGTGSGSAKEKWDKLIDDDLEMIKGQRDQLEGRLKQRYGLAKGQIHRNVADWFRTLK